MKYNWNKTWCVLAGMAIVENIHEQKWIWVVILSLLALAIIIFDE